MRTEFFVIWRYIRVKGDVSLELKRFEHLGSFILLTVARRFLCYCSSLFVRRWFIHHENMPL